MFKCEISGKIVGPRERQYKIPVKTRPQTYVHKVWNREKKREEEIITQGTEIVKEAVVCYEEFLKWREANA